MILDLPLMNIMAQRAIAARQSTMVVATAITTTACGDTARAASAPLGAHEDLLNRSHHSVAVVPCRVVTLGARQDRLVPD